MPKREPRLGRGQAAVYAAEADALHGLGICWRRVSEAQAYADRLIGSDWFGQRWPQFGHCQIERRSSGATWSTCTVLGGGHPGGTAGAGLVLLAPGHLTQTVLLHELAHLLAGPETGHSLDYARVQLELVRREMGFFAYAAYRGALQSGPQFVMI